MSKEERKTTEPEENKTLKDTMKLRSVKTESKAMS